MFLFHLLQELDAVILRSICHFFSDLFVFLVFHVLQTRCNFVFSFRIRIRFLATEERKREGAFFLVNPNYSVSGAAMQVETKAAFGRRAVTAEEGMRTLHSDSR